MSANSNKDKQKNKAKLDEKMDKHKKSGKQEDLKDILRVEIVQKGGIKQFFLNNIVSILSLIVSVLMLSQICLMKQQLDLETNNQSFVLEDEISFEYENDNVYKVSFKKEQGNVKKAYLVDIRGDEKIYELLTPDLNDGNIELSVVPSSNKSMFNEEGIGEEGLKVNDIKQLALVVLDTTNQWNIYYFVVRPQIEVSGLEYHFKISSSDEETYMEYKKDLKKDKMDYCYIDCQLINLSTIENKIASIPEQYDYYFFSKPIAIQGGKGEAVISNPYMRINYTLPTGQDVYENIMQIYSDISVTY